MRMAGNENEALKCFFKRRIRLKFGGGNANCRRFVDFADTV